MSWADLGLIFPVRELSDWAVSHAYVPTPLLMDDRIRVYVAFLDANKVGRLGFIDIDLDDPERVLGYSKTPALVDSGENAFDRDGVTPLSVVTHAGEIRLYYAGWRLLSGGAARYRLLTGLATSRMGERFERHRDTPLLASSSPDTLVKTAGVVALDGNVWRCWYADDVGLINLNGKSVPTYQLRTMASSDGLNWPSDGRVVFDTTESDIIGYGRSAIWREGDLLHGLFSVRRRDGGYRAIEHATSRDGYTWTQLGLGGLTFPASKTRDGQKEACFPGIVQLNGRLLMFYNGDGFGRDGLRAAVWSGSR